MTQKAFANIRPIRPEEWTTTKNPPTEPGLWFARFGTDKKFTAVKTYTDENGLWCEDIDYDLPYLTHDLPPHTEWASRDGGKTAYRIEEPVLNTTGG